MDDFEYIVREFAMGKIKEHISGKSSAMVEYIIFAYLGRLVIDIKRCQESKVFKNPAISQFLELACKVKERTGEKVIEKIFNELTILVDNHDDIFENQLTDSQREEVSSIVSMTVSN